MLVPEEVNYEIGELSIHGLSVGDNEAPILLCLHGWLDNAASFVPMFPYLKSHRVVAIDWLGHGFSSHRSKDAHYHFIDWVYDLLQLFEVNQWHNIDIVGHSMGGMVASAFSAAFPEKVKSLTLLDSIGLLSASSEETTEQLRTGMLSRLAGRNKQKKYHSSIESAVQARLMASDLTKEAAELIVKRGLTKESEGFRWRADSRLRAKSPYRLTAAQAQQFIKDIKTPVQLIYGDSGLDMVAKGLKSFGPLFQSFKCHQVKGGHHFHMEEAKTTAELIENFTNSQPN